MTELNKPLRVLVACEMSGRVRDAFTAAGCDAMSADLLPSETPGKHYQGDVRDILNDGYDLLIAFPPCTYLSVVGNAWLKRPGRLEARAEAFDFFMLFINAPIPRICVENPVGYPNTAYRKPDQIIHPYYFGDSDLKRTCFWLKNLPPLWYWQDKGGLFQRTGTDRPEPLKICKSGRKLYFVDAQSGGKDRAKTRSKTFPSVARAMAEQWSCLPRIE